MATTADKTQPASRPLTVMGMLAPVLGWLFPGLGHLAQKRWVRGILLMISITAMFALGILMDGKIYTANTGDILDILGFIGDLGAGGLYFIARAQGWGQGAINFATADYGTKALIIAGLLSIISAVDAHHIAIRKKP